MMGTVVASLDVTISMNMMEMLSREIYIKHRAERFGKKLVLWIVGLNFLSTA